jgi:hypothetical protein
MKLVRLVQRCALLLLAMAGVLFVVAHHAAAQPSPLREAGVQWRRTASGWERADLWNVGSFAQESNDMAKPTGTAPAPLPAVHPVVIAALLLAAAGLLAIPNRSRRRPSGKS